jgi:hypothetical protein
MNVELQEWQKQHIYFLEKMPPHTNIRIATNRRGQVYIYMSPKTQKELIQSGTTLDRYHQMSTMWKTS